MNYFVLQVLSEQLSSTFCFQPATLFCPLAMSLTMYWVKWSEDRKRKRRTMVVGPTVFKLQLLPVEERGSLLLVLVWVTALSCPRHHDNRAASGFGKERLEKGKGEGGRVLQPLSVVGSVFLLRLEQEGCSLLGFWPCQVQPGRYTRGKRRKLSPSEFSSASEPGVLHVSLLTLHSRASILCSYSEQTDRAWCMSLCRLFHFGQR